jgi:hypothetical protein
MLGVAMKSTAQRRLQRRRAFDRLQAALTATQARGAAEPLSPSSPGDKAFALRGQGAFLIPGQSAQNIRLERRAMRERCLVRLEIRAELMERQCAIAASPESSNREAILAFRAILRVG